MQSHVLSFHSEGFLHREQDRCPERCRDASGQTTKGKDIQLHFILFLNPEFRSQSAQEAEILIGKI